MKTLRKIRKNIAKKLKNRNAAKETTMQDPRVSSSKDLELSEDVFKTTMEQQVVTSLQDKATDILDDACENSNSLEKFIAHEDLKPCETIEHIAASKNTGATNDQDTTAIIKTDMPESNAPDIPFLAIDREINEPEPNAYDSPSVDRKITEPSFDREADTTDTSSPAELRSDTVGITQAIVAGIIGTALLVGSIVFYALKIHITVAVAMGVVGLMCMSFALYNVLKPDTKLEKVDDIEQLNLSSPSKENSG